MVIFVIISLYVKVYQSVTLLVSYLTHVKQKEPPETSSSGRPHEFASDVSVLVDMW